MRYEDTSQADSLSNELPIARDDADALAAGTRGPATGNVITGDGTQTGSVGADLLTAGAKITSLEGANGSDSDFAGGKLSVTGEFGKLSVDAQGNYSYLANEGAPETARDHFTYKLADARGNSDTARLTIEIGQTPSQVASQQVVVGPDGVVVLPAGVDLNDIRVVGRDLVVTLPDGSQMVIVDGAVFVPQLVIDDVQIPATNLAALLIDNEPQPAAGGQPPSGGGNFEVPVGPLDPGVPLGDLIPPTELDYTPPEYIDVGVEEEDPNEPPFASSDAVNVSDEGLDAGLPDTADTAGNPDTTNATVVNGSILAGDPDGDSLTITLGVPSETLFSHGVEIDWVLSAGGTVLTGFAGDTPVLVVTMQDDGDYTVVLSAPIDHPDATIEDGASFVVPVNVDDGEASIDVAITVTIEDDSPLVTSASVGSSVLLDETDGANPVSSGAPIVVSSDDPMIVAPVNYGADGQGPAPLFGLSLLGGASSILSNVQTALGDHAITLTLTSSTLITATYEDGGTQTAFTIQMNGDGTITVTQFTALEHLVDGPPGPAHDDALSLSSEALGNLVNATVTYEDYDGDTETATVAIGGAITFEDDGPSIDVIETIPTDQEGQSPLLLSTGDDGTEGDGSTADSTTADFAGVFSLVSDGGGDGAAGTPDIVYSLNLKVAEGSDSNLDSHGQTIFLYNVGGVVIGSTSAVEPASATDASVVFALSVNGDGVVTLTQYQQIDHALQAAPNDAPFADQFAVLGSGFVEIVASATITDNDGDTATDEERHDFGDHVRFADDGPDIEAALVADASLRIDETDNVVAAGGETDAPGGNLGTVTVAAATLFSVSHAGVSADAPTTLGYALTLPSDGVESGLLLSTTNDPIYLYNIGGTVVGSTSATLEGVIEANIVFDVSIDAGTGAVTMTQYLAVEHPVGGASHDEDSSGLDEGVLNITVTATDYDGDTDSDSVDLGSIIRFEDDGPTIDVTANLTLEPTITLLTGDAGTEAGGSTSDSTTTGNFGGVFGLTYTTGSDGAAVPDLTFTLGTPGGDSGLESHDVDINLFYIAETNTVVGSTATNIGDVTLENTVFDVKVDADGVVTLTQYQQIDHALQAAPNAAPFADQLASLLDTSVTLTASSTITDNDDDTASDSATINIGANLRFADDGPVINQGPTLSSSVTLDETDGDSPLSSGLPISATSAGAIITSSVDYGADGQGPAPVYGLSLLGTAVIGSTIPSGLATADGNLPITLTLTSATLITATYQEGGTQIAFTIQMNPNGSITVTQHTALEHLDDGPAGPAHDDSLDLDNALGNLVNATVTYQDFDGDTATATVGIGGAIVFKDDGPNASLADTATDTLVLDESPAGLETDGDSDPAGLASITANFANNFAAPDYGADGAGTTGYTLVLVGTDVGSGMYALGLNGAPGAEILLNQDAVTGDITGSVGGTDYFTISVNPGTGVVTFTQLANVYHGDDGNDDDTSSLVVDQGVLTIVQKVTDADGDTDTASIDLGNEVFQIEDDGPNAAVDDLVATDTLVLDESPVGTETEGDSNPVGLASTTANFANNFVAPVNYGTDGEGSTAYALVLTGIDVGSGLFALGAGGGAGAEILLNQDAITGDITGSVGGTDYFTITVDSETGVVTFTQLANVYHDDQGSDDDTSSLTVDVGVLVIEQTVTDADGDSDTAAIDLGDGVFQIEDDGPTATLTTVVEPLLVVDETVLSTDAGPTSFAGLFSTSFGTDGAADAASTTYSLDVIEGPSGLIDTASGEAVNLSVNGGVVEGRTAIGGVLVFTVSVDSAGAVTLNQLRAVVHNDPLDNDEPGDSAATLSADNLVTLTVTVTDKDGDTDSATANIGQNLRFEDDGPLAVNDVVDQPTENQPFSFDVFGNDDFGADDVDTDNSPIVRVTFTQPPVGEGTISYDPATGQFTFTPAPGQVGTTSFTYTIIDTDGDPSTATVTIRLAADSIPDVVDVVAAVDDDGLAGNNPASTTGDIDANDDETIPPGDPSEAVFEGQINVDFGSDTGTVSFLNLHGTSGTVGTETVDYTWDAGTNTLTATINAGPRDGTELFEVTLTPSGAYTVTLLDNVLHAAGGDEASAPLVVLNYRAEDSDTDVDTTGTLTIEFNDDAPTVSNVVVGSGVTLDETTAVTPAGFPISAIGLGAVITATSAFGADGAAAADASVYGLTVVGGGSTPLETAIGGYAITLVQTDAQTITGQYNDGVVKTAFTVEIDAEGKITVTQEVPLEHTIDGSTPEQHNDPLDLSGLVDASITITDGDGDTATGSAGIGDLIVFRDDGPTINVTQVNESGVVLTTQDADTIGSDSDADASTAKFNDVFGLTSAGGADGAATPTLAYDLNVANSVSGLFSHGVAITLFEVNDVIYGTTAGVAPADASDPNIVFSVAVASDGTVTLTQYQQVDHGLQAAPNDAPFDDQTAILAAGKITLTASSTITDNDGDTASDQEVVDLGGNIRFADDGPDISAALSGTQIRIDETDGVTAAGGEVDAAVGTNLGTVTVLPATYLNLTNVHTSADSPTTLSYSFQVTDGASSGLLLSTTNAPILLYIDGNTVTGSTSATEGGINGTNTVFTAVIDPSTGAVTLTQFLAVEHPTPGVSHDEDSLALALNALQVKVTATDYDGDTDSATVDLGSVIRFEDDGPSFGAGGAQPTLIVDETILATDATQNFAAAFAPLFGSDGPAAANSISYALGVNAGATGIFDTATGLEVVLTVVGGQVIGTAGPGGATVFTVSVAANGDVTLDQVRAVLHNDPLDHDEPGASAETLNADNLITLTATATDSDGDTATSTIGIGSNLQFEDDGPTFTSKTDVVLDDSATPTGSGTFVYSIGADEHGEFVIDQEISLGSTFTGFVGTAAITNAVVTNGAADADNETFGIEFDYAPNPDEPGTTVHATGTVTFDKDGNYTVTLDAPIESYSISSVQNGQAPIFHDRDVNNDGDTTDGVDVDNGVAVVELADDFFIQFTGASGVTGSAGTFGHDETFGGGSPGEVKISSTAIGVFGNSVQDDDVLDYNFYSSDPGANEDNPPTTSADTAFIQVTQFNGAEDFIVVLKLADPNSPGTFITRTLVIEPGDVLTSNVPGYPTLGNGEGLIIIEPSDYINLTDVPDNYEIVGMQLRSSTEGLQAEPNEVYNFEGDLGAFDNSTTVFGPSGGGDQGTNDNDVFKILDIGVVRTTTNVEALTLTFDVTVTDEDGDSFQQTLVVNPPAEALAASTMAFSQEPANDTSSMTLFAAESGGEQLFRTAANNNTGVVAAAVAASGLVAGQAAARTDPQVDDGFTAMQSIDGLDQLPPATLDDLAVEAGAGRLLSGNEVRQLAEDGEAPDGSGLDTPNVAQPLDQPTDEADMPTDLLEGTDSAGDAAAFSPIAPMVVMPTVGELEQLGVDGEGSQQSVTVEKVLAEALDGGAGGGDVDALLAALPGAANGENPALDALASVNGGAVPGWDMGHDGYFQPDALMKVVMEDMSLHHDAVQPAMNG